VTKAESLSTLASAITCLEVSLQLGDQWLHTVADRLKVSVYSISLLVVGDYKHWTRDPRTGDPMTRGPEDRGPEDQGPNDLVLLHLAFMTEMQLVSMF